MTPEGKDQYKDSNPELKIEAANLPTRTISTFWNSDILPTAIGIRKLRDPDYREDEVKMLEFAWNWLKEDEKNQKLITDGSLEDEKTIAMIPTEAILNYQTVYFFTMQNDFKRNAKSDIFEPFVAYQPGTFDWENDIRKITFGFISNALKHQPLDASQVKNDIYTNPITNALLKRVDGNEKLVQRYEDINALTWVVLMKYYLELRRRESNALSNSINISRSL